MSNLGLVIIFSLIGGLISLVGGVSLLASKHRVKLAEYATAFAAGALLAAAFIDIIPDAMHDDSTGLPLFILLGIILFFMLESSIHWFHHHRHHADHQPTDPVVPLVIIGDTVHNFIDGIAIAAGFLVDPITGIIVTIAVAAHEIPQEIGDFGILISKGLKRSKTLLINGLSALATTVSAVLFFLLGESFDIPLTPVLGIVAGFFIYIALSDIIPSIHSKTSRRRLMYESVILLAGVIVVGLLVYLLHGFIE
jgi:zinc and cadmium transporter